MATGSKAARKGSNPNNTFDVIFAGTNQKVTTTGTSAQSTAVGSATTIVRLYASQNMYIQISSNPTAAVASSTYLPTGIVEYFGITPGDKIAAIQDTTTGTLFITEGASS